EPGAGAVLVDPAGVRVGLLGDLEPGRTGVEGRLGLGERGFRHPVRPDGPGEDPQQSGPYQRHAETQQPPPRVPVPARGEVLAQARSQPRRRGGSDGPGRTDGGDSAASAWAACGAAGLRNRFRKASARAATSAIIAGAPAVDQTSSTRLCGSKISSLDCGSL